MSILIKGMKIPESCGKCDFNVSSLYCKRTRSEIDRDYEYRERLLDCPISALPDNHGRLVDADNIYTVDRYNILTVKMEFTEDEAPTIVEAEGE